MSGGERRDAESLELRGAKSGKVRKRKGEKKDSRKRRGRGVVWIDRHMERVRRNKQPAIRNTESVIRYSSSHFRRFGIAQHAHAMGERRCWEV